LVISKEDREIGVKNGIHLIGATKPYHLDDAVAAISIKLTPDEIKHLEEAYRPHTVLGYA
jgi:aryl-alcohol dehydrogenase-like predicted oxidoreductase